MLLERRWDFLRTDARSSEGYTYSRIILVRATFEISLRLEVSVVRVGSLSSQVGERTREGNDLYWEMVESNVITVGGGGKACLAFGQMNEPPGARQRIALVGLSLAEYFRDEMNQVRY